MAETGGTRRRRSKRAGVPRTRATLLLSAAVVVAALNGFGPTQAQSVPVVATTVSDPGAELATGTSEWSVELQDDLRGQGLDSTDAGAAAILVLLSGRATLDETLAAFEYLAGVGYAPVTEQLAPAPGTAGGGTDGWAAGQVTRWLRGALYRFVGEDYGSVWRDDGTVVVGLTSGADEALATRLVEASGLDATIRPVVLSRRQRSDLVGDVVAVLRTAGIDIGVGSNVRTDRVVLVGSAADIAVAEEVLAGTGLGPFEHEITAIPDTTDALFQGGVLERGSGTAPNPCQRGGRAVKGRSASWIIHRREVVAR
jgi:hypothetical protein